MKCFKCNSDRNIITMLPTNKEERQKFWTYRCDDIQDFYTIRLCALSLATFVLLGYYMSEHEEDTPESKNN